MGRERRTHPSFLSNNEAARESRRTSELVRSIVGIEPVTKIHTKQAQSSWKASSELRQKKRLPKWKGDRRVGETDRFIVDCNSEDGLIRVYGKEVPRESPFKLDLTSNQAIDVLSALARMRNAMQDTTKLKLAGKTGFVVHYDGNLVMLNKIGSHAECPFKLAFDKAEIAKVIYLLRKAQSFF